MPKLTARTRNSKPDASGEAPTIATYANAVRHLLERPNLERMRVIRYDADTFKLDRMKRLLEALENPHEQVRMVHVAGTVGKGSTVAMIAAMLEGCGYTVGQYTSPHLVDMRERVRINNEMIARTEFTDLVRQVAMKAHELEEDPTFFEIMTAVAFLHFANQAVDIAIIEVGLGGRLDATNLITPEVTIVTHIDIDHAKILGNTPAKIAREKAGIFKRGVPALAFAQSDEVDDALRAVAEEVEAPLKFVNKDIEFSYRFGVSEELGPHTRVCMISDTNQFMHLPVPLPGEHQAINCGLALATIDILSGAGFRFDEVPLHQGLAATSVPGRMELIWDRPRILIDGAHNAVALSSLIRCVGAHVPYDSMVCVFGCCEDKDVPALLERVALGGDKIIFTKSRTTPRAADPDELARQFAEISGKMCQVARTLPEALDLASRAVGRDDLIVVTGSFYLAGEAKKYLTEMDKKRIAAGLTR
ncbi:MAG: bifunctional folylpolyglutamate synthase/dihydrofolate synthase [Phycisphaerales bacterium]|nr:bifunctional folylpolyglutamate synthase/dihydrofolate synthase [Phycisphaerales bacterium]